MEPLEKVMARAEALSVLGLSQDANSDDIREAWRHIAFHAHPDHKGGDSSGFDAAKTAYDLLRREGLTSRKSAGPATPRRPRLKKRVIDLGSDDIDACRNLLNPDPALPHQSETQESDHNEQAINASDHVPEAIGCFGRELTYFVSTSVREGANRVALPTSVLASRRKTEAEILTFKSKNSGPGEVVVPEDICERKFPGAKSVKIRFEADQHMRDEFWLVG